MAKRKIVIDWNVMVEIKKGGVETAKTLRFFLKTAEVYYDKQVLSEAITQADKRLLNDLMGKGLKLAPRPAATMQLRFQRFYEMNKAYTRMSSVDMMIAATAASLDAEVFTLDDRFADALQKSKLKVAPEAKSHPRVSGKISPSHARARALLGLPLLHISPDGRILSGPLAKVQAPPPKVVETWNRPLQVGPDGRVVRAPAGKPPPSPPNIVNGPRTPGGARTTANDPNQVHPVARPSPAPPAPRPTNRPAPAPPTPTIDGRPVVQVDPPGSYGSNHERARTIQPPKVDPATTIQNGVNTVNGRAQAVGGGVTLFFRGANFVVHQINDGIQERKLKANWAELEPSITKRLGADPTLGALIIGQYSIGQTASFQRLESSFGFDREDAWARYNAKSKLRATGHAMPDSLEVHWSPPRQPVDVTKLPTPFPAAGLATFVPGREELVRVSFSHIPGFDDKMRSVEKVNTAYDVLSFFYLLPPGTIHYIESGAEQTEVLPVLAESPAEVAHSELKHIHVPVVQLDSRINPYNATAAMIYPADDFTARVFADTKPTEGLNLLKKYRMEKLRWVKPQKMRVLRVFSQEQLEKQLADHDRQAEYDRIQLRSSNVAHVTCGPQHAHRGSWCF